MRIALILLSILALVFIGSISWSLLSQDGWLITKKISTSVDTTTEAYWRNQIKTEEKIEKLTALVEDIAKKNGTLPSEAGEAQSGQTTNTETSRNIVKISGKLLSLLMPTVTPSLTENTDIFWLHIFDKSMEYSVYDDAKLSLRITPINIPYDTLIKNMYALGGSVYSVNETKSFPFRSFYLNPPKSDTLARLVIEMEWQSIALEIPKTKFSILKDLLLGKTTPPKTTTVTKTPPVTNQTKTLTGSTKTTTGSLKTVTGSIQR